MLIEALVWLHDPEPHSAAVNMAIDEVLLATATVPLLRCYRWERPAVSFGYFGTVSEAEAAWPGRDIVRRWTGGGIVPHGEDFTYSLIVPRDASCARIGAAESYRLIHEAVVTALGAGARATLATAPAGRMSAACFENPVQHDLLADGAKIAGAAQRRTRAGLLHQGSVQLHPLPADFPTRLASALASGVQVRALSEETLRTAHDLATRRYATEAWLRRKE